jgi:hypothetical protein
LVSQLQVIPVIGSKYKSESNEGDDDLAHGADDEGSCTLLTQLGPAEVQFGSVLQEQNFGRRGLPWFFSFLAVLPVNCLDHAKTDQQSRGKRQENGPSVERNAFDRGWIGHMWILLWLMAIADVLWD